jgi:hypothetical protein
VKPFKAGLGCVFAVLFWIVEIYLIAMAFDSNHDLSTRFGYGFASILALMVAQWFHGPAPHEILERKHFDHRIDQLQRQVEDLQRQHEHDVISLQNRLDQER